MTEQTLEETATLAARLRQVIAPEDMLTPSATIVFMRNAAEDYRAQRARDGQFKDVQRCHILTDPIGALTSIGEHPGAINLSTEFAFMPETLLDSREGMEGIVAATAGMRVGTNLAVRYPRCSIMGISGHVGCTVRAEVRRLTEEDVQEERLLYGRDTPATVGDEEARIVVSLRIKVLLVIKSGI